MKNNHLLIFSGLVLVISSHGGYSGLKLAPTPTSFVADNLIDLVGKLNGTYAGTHQIIEDQRPNSEPQIIKGDGGMIWINSNLKPGQASFNVEFPGISERFVTLSNTAPGRIRFEEKNEEVLGCNTSFEVEVKNNSFEFTYEDLKYDGVTPEYCLSQWPYPIMGKIKWIFDGNTRQIRIEALGEVEIQGAKPEEKTLRKSTLVFEVNEE